MGDVAKRSSIDKQMQGHWRVTLNHPPINTVDDQMHDQIYDLVEEIEEKPSLKVATFESVNPEFFLAHGVAESSSRFGNSASAFLESLNSTSAGE